jgi:hypothetical protein
MKISICITYFYNRNNIYNLLDEINKYNKKNLVVSIRNDNGKFRAYIKHNHKVINCGSFNNEIDAAKAYNKQAEELNKSESTKIKYSLNVFDDHDLSIK